MRDHSDGLHYSAHTLLTKQFLVFSKHLSGKFIQLRSPIDRGNMTLDNNRNQMITLS